MYLKSLFILVVFIATSLNTLTSQDRFSNIQHELKIQAGISMISLSDHRMSAQTNHSWAPTFGLNYKKMSDNSRQELSLLYSYKNSFDRDRVLDITYHLPSLSYSFESKVGEVFIGGFFETSTFLLFPRNKSGMFNYNPVSYSIFNSIGPKVSFDSRLGGVSGDKFGVSGSAQVSLLNYNIRPAFGHPYPEEYLESGVFSPTKRDMAGPLLRSGKIQTIDKHQSIQVKIGAHYYISESIKVGFDVRMTYVHNKDFNSSTFQTAEFLLGVGYVY